MPTRQHRGAPRGELLTSGGGALSPQLAMLPTTARCPVTVSFTYLQCLPGLWRHWSVGQWPTRCREPSLSGVGGWDRAWLVGHPWFRLWKLKSIHNCPSRCPGGDKSAATFAPGSASCHLYQTEQKGEAELPWVTRKWRVKGEEKSSPRDGNRARELFIFSSDLECLSEDAQTRSCVCDGGFSGGKSQC